MQYKVHIIKFLSCQNILLKTGSGILNSKITNRENVEIEMGKAKFYWKEIPLTKELDLTVIYKLFH